METLTQVCGQCGHEYEFTAEFFCRSRYSGLTIRCRACARNNVASANAAKEKTVTLQTALKASQEAATKSMIKSLGDLSHVPERLRPQYEHYKNMLVLGEYHAMEFRLTTRAA